MAKAVKNMSASEYLAWIKERKALTTLDKKLKVRANPSPKKPGKRYPIQL